MKGDIMKLTNHHGLPESFVAFAKDDKYSAGVADISVTGLIDSPRIRILKRLNAEKMETDVVDMVWPLFVTAVHHILESSSNGVDIIQEERLFHEFGGWTVSGAIDHQKIVDGAIQITDYKVTGAYSVMMGKDEWVQQQNCYANLVRKVKKMPVESVQICAIVRDWNRRKAQMEKDYPQAPVVIIDLPLWTEGYADQYMLERVALHQIADMEYDLNGNLPRCSDEDRWLRGEKWAVMKGKAKRATKLCDSEAEAISYIDGDPQLRIEHRKGEHVRCSGDYCGVAAFCDQWKAEG